MIVIFSESVATLGLMGCNILAQIPEQKQ